MQKTDSLREWTPLLDAEQEEVRAAEAISVLVFRLGIAWLALPTHVCKEVAERRAIHTLPHRRGGILLGLVNIRGELQLCISLGRLLGLEHGHVPGATLSPQSYQRLLVMERAGNRWVFIVDEIHGIHHFLPHALRHVPVPVAEATPTLTGGIIDWQDKEVRYLDAELLFTTLHREIV
jgi:chemotaxis-related protein WspD